MKEEAIFKSVKESMEITATRHQALCPVCGDECQHALEPFIVKGNDGYEGGWGGRGDLSVIPFVGECGSKWALCAGLHKGKSELFVMVMENCEDSRCIDLSFDEEFFKRKLKEEIHE